ncbi:MAG: BMP family ABC transporter substrate-binding protein [Firmicutes bacterium]|nr:BMP family ABC transporter substrate-binding protein [Bacillota bacterium]
MKIKIKHILAVLISAVIIISCALIKNSLEADEITDKTITVGFVYDGDEATPYTNNFIRAQKELESVLGDRVKIYVKSNVPNSDGENAIRELADKGCDIIFTNSYGYKDTAKKLAGEYPDIQFCEATADNANEEPVYNNYHTFMGEIYQGRYISGVVAGLKINEMVKNGEITEEQAKIGYVAAYPLPEVISGYTAFFLGVRSEAPYAVMNVKYTNAWTDFKQEKKCAEEFIDEGCIIISQHSDTIGPAVACENAINEFKTVYHIGYNKGMIDVAPRSSLISTRINWQPYIIGAVEAVLKDKKIEEYVEGNENGNDIGAGFEKNWVEVVEVNSLIAAYDTDQKIAELTEEFKKGGKQVFVGDYIGADPNDPSDTYDLRQGYEENKNSSAPTFHYVLKDVITVE